MNKQSAKKAFSLLELSVVIIIVGVLAAGIVSGKRMISQAAIKSAQALTKSSSINSIPDLTLWLEPTLDESITGASSGNNLSNNNYVSAWNDISGNKINLTQSSSNNNVNQPKYLVNGINGLPTLSFDGTSDVLYSTVAPIDSGSSQYTMIAVFRSITLSASPVLVAQQLGATDNRSGAICLNNSNIKFSGQSNDTASLGTIAANGNYISVMVVNNSDAAGNVSLYLNSNDKSSKNSSSVSLLSIGSNFFSVGALVSDASTYTSYANVYLSEVLVFNRALKPSEVTLINNYLSKKYNITVS